MDAGAYDYISKPINIDQLFSLMNVWLYKREDKPIDNEYNDARIQVQNEEIEKIEVDLLLEVDLPLLWI